MPGSTPGPPNPFSDLAKLDVVGSSPVARSLEVLGVLRVRIALAASGRQRFFFDGHSGGRMRERAQGGHRRVQAGLAQDVLWAGALGTTSNTRRVGAGLACPREQDRNDPQPEEGSLMTGQKQAPITLGCVGLLAVALSGCVRESAARQRAPVGASAFSFAVFGDSRTMMYLPHRAEQKAEAENLIADMLELEMPPKEAKQAVEKYVKLKYDSTSGELTKLVMPFMTKSEVMTVTMDSGWAAEASVEDVKLQPGVHYTMYRIAGGDWVTAGVLKALTSGQADFALHTGDWVWWGKQGSSPSDNPYWNRVDERFLNHVTPPDDRLKQAGLDGRVFGALGNHEVWEDSTAEGFRSAFPYVTKLGMSDDQFTYKFDYGGARFIFLWTGAYDPHDPSGWNATQPTYAKQMTELRTWLDEAKAGGIKNVFVSFHAPVFCRSGMGAIPEGQNPHKLFASYAQDLHIVVFTGHVHTTEAFDVDGVKYLVLGGGGAEQDPILPGRTRVKVPANYPRDQYWNGAAPKEEYNYLLVSVEPGEKTRFMLNRYRPWATRPFETVELFK